MQYKRKKGLIYSPKRQLIYLLKNYTNIPTCDRRNKIRFIGMDTLSLNKNAFILPDSICDIFTIFAITEKNDNYVLKSKHLTKKTIYCIDIGRQNDNKLYRIISIKEECDKNYSQIRVGEQLKMTIYSFFSEDISMIKKDSEIINIVPSLAFQQCFLFENIWVVSFPFLYLNIFETPNLKGLYYIPPK
ncbi:MAG: hypothetical protein LBR36_08215 [Bacteroidales bacterium]|nr:hypothetical protein [Bacteroidales bacterium]